MATWMLMELIRDPPLLQVVRAEMMQAFKVDDRTGQYRLNAQTLLSMPITQSVYTETLRMHISFNATREVMRDIWIGGYYVRKGSILQSPTQLAHYDEAVWGTVDHPAAEFWAARHLTYAETIDAMGNVTTKPQFSMHARPTSFFPFGEYFSMHLFFTISYCTAFGS